MNSNILILAAGVIVVLIVIGIVASMLFRTDDVEGRLEAYVGDGKKEEKEKLPREQRPNIIATQVNKAVAEKGFATKMQTDLTRAALKMTVGEWLVIKALVILGSTVFLSLVLYSTIDFFAYFVGILGGPVLGWFLPEWWLSYKRNKRMKDFNNQLGDTINLLANSLRSGYSLLQSMELVSREAAPPMADEFKRVVVEVGLGLSTTEALNNMLRRVPSEDLDFLITAVNIQHEVGGNLAQILETIGHTIRERVRIKGEIRVLTAQGMASGYVISALPVGLALFLFVFNPTYMRPMFSFKPYPYICMPICGAIMIITGFLAIKKIVTIDI